MKSTWPGVSIRVMRVSPHSTMTAALLMVMPLAFSSGSKSVVVLPSSTSPDLVLGAAEVEDALGGRGFARVHVGDDADVAKFFEHVRTGKKNNPSRPPDAITGCRDGTLS